MINLGDIVKSFTWKSSSVSQDQLVDNLRKYGIRWYELNKDIPSEMKFPLVMDKYPDLAGNIFNSLMELEKMPCFQELDHNGKKEEIRSVIYHQRTTLSKE